MVDKIEIKNISLPADIQRAMATEAEEAKRAKAKVTIVNFSEILGIFPNKLKKKHIDR